MNEQQRFFSHVIKGPDSQSCWLWVGAISDDGYGIFWRKDKDTGKDAPIRAHRYALLILSGEEGIGSEHHALHRCDNTLCVKATDDASSHLTLGTRSENMIDRSLRGRSNFQRKSASKAQRAASWIEVSLQATAVASPGGCHSVPTPIKKATAPTVAIPPVVATFPIFHRPFLCTNYTSFNVKTIVLWGLYPYSKYLS